MAQDLNIQFDSVDYQKYIHTQTVSAMSHEEDSFIWSDGQKKFINNIIHFFKPDDFILDCACGDGVGLSELRKLGYNAIGVDFSLEKVIRAIKSGNTAHHADMHDMPFLDETFDIIISSHTLEHAYDPAIVLDEFRRVLKKNGLLFIVLPYPDCGDGNIDVHIAKDILGTSDPVDGKEKLFNLLTKHNYDVIEYREDDYREPEIWLFLRKIEITGV